MPARILSSVDLPVPFAPTRPTRSLGVISQSSFLKEELVAIAFSGGGELDHGTGIIVSREIGRRERNPTSNLVNYNGGLSANCVFRCSLILLQGSES